MSVLLFATLDTKGREADFVRAELARLGVAVELVDTGCIGPPQVEPDVPREALFGMAGTTLAALVERRDRGAAVDAAAEGARALALERHARGTLDGVLALGGSAGTTIGTAAMRALPLGVPKLMVSTLASGQVAPFVGTKDVLMMHSVVDILGLNRISRLVLARAAQAMAGMVRGGAPVAAGSDRPLIAASMFGVTTPCVERAREVLEAAGFEVLVFHATGSGGRTLESLVADGLIAGVLDITTTELADELVGGVLSAGPERLTAAGRAGIPQVVSVGATDMVNFFAPDTVPARFAGRRFHHHNANVTLMRTTSEECAAIGRDLGAKLGSARGPVRILLPARGVSAIDREGQSFDDPAARRALFDAVRATCGAVPVTELDLHINDRAFAEACAHALLAQVAATRAR
jgi:uncharacterized protein (UPF0261 family)